MLKYVPVSWARFSFRPCKKKTSLQKKNCFKKIHGPIIQLILVTWQLLTIQLLPRGMPHNIKFKKTFLKF